VCNQQSKKNTPKFDLVGLILKGLEETRQDFEKVRPENGIVFSFPALP
jgi:hypothetical protein